MLDLPVDEQPAAAHLDLVARHGDHALDQGLAVGLARRELPERRLGLGLGLGFGIRVQVRVRVRVRVRAPRTMPVGRRPRRPALPAADTIWSPAWAQGSGQGQGSGGGGCDHPLAWTGVACTWPMCVAGAWRAPHGLCTTLTLTLALTLTLRRAHPSSHLVRVRVRVRVRSTAFHLFDGELVIDLERGEHGEGGDVARLDDEQPDGEKEGEGRHELRDELVRLLRTAWERGSVRRRRCNASRWRVQRARPLPS